MRNRSSPLKPNISPLVVRYYVPEGTRVKPGDVVLRIDPGESAAKIPELESQMEQASARAAKEVAELRVKAMNAQIALSDAEAALATARVDATIPRELISRLDFDRHRGELDRTARDSRSSARNWRTRAPRSTAACRMVRWKSASSGSSTITTSPGCRCRKSAPRRPAWCCTASTTTGWAAGSTRARDHARQQGRRNRQRRRDARACVGAGTGPARTSRGPGGAAGVRCVARPARVGADHRDRGRPIASPSGAMAATSPSISICRRRPASPCFRA